MPLSSGDAGDTGSPVSPLALAGYRDIVDASRTVTGTANPAPGSAASARSSEPRAPAARAAATPGGDAGPGASVSPLALTGYREIVDAAQQRPRTPAATAEPPRPDRPVPIERDVGARMSRLFAFDLTGVSVVPESPAVTGSTQAVTRGDQVQFRAGAYQPGTRDGDWLLAHELAHVVQQRGGRGERMGSRGELEGEADRAAHLAARGQAAPIRLRADRTTAYAFDDSDVHAADVDDVQLDAVDEPAATPPGAGVDVATVPAPALAHPAPAGSAAMAAPPDVQAEDAFGGSAPAAEGDVSAVISADAAPPGLSGAGGAAGGGPSATPTPDAPSVAGARPEAGLAQLRGVRPDKLGPVFGQLHAAIGADVAQERAKLQANPPRQMRTGAPAAAGAGAGARGAAPRVRSAAAAAGPGAAGAAAHPRAGGPGGAAAPGAEIPDHPVKAEAPGVERDKRDQQDKAVEQQRAAPQIIADVARSIASWFSSWFGHGHDGDDPNEEKVSDEEARQMSGEVDQLPTGAGISTDPGRAPEVAMQGQAKSSADQDRARLEATTGRLETQGRADSRAPMGEDHIEPAAPPVELTARALPRGAAPAARALPTVEGAAPTEEIGIIAQEQHGAEIDAALARASADVTAERAKHAQDEDQARRDSDAQIHELETTAHAEQAAARAEAQAEVRGARGQWQAEIDKKGHEARTKADKRVAEGMADVTAKQNAANAEAAAHIAEGKRKAEEEKQKGEQNAADAKEKAEEESSGFWGWIASKAKAVFNAIKKAVHAAIDACRKAIKAVIDGAKKLAMAAIDAVRKVIVTAIKAIGEALIEISDVLLAAFPELKARFQAAIHKAVDRAVDTVNRLADGLKQAVQKAVDRLGDALDHALDLLEKGLDAIIDAASAVVQGAIKLAKAVAEALGSWIMLIKDIASGPGDWIRKLGHSVVDGIQNHLWAAFKTAVLDWFKAKVFELLGVGGVILEFLLEGGLTKDAIIQMALDALLVALPAALISVLIEKLVTMIIPGIGAIMAIIDGLKAAWGTITRIIAAFSKFMEFLRAVKDGAAGPLFAGLLAAAAIVLLDFVANWLLKKLASAASKVGDKLKGLADKFKAKRKAKQDAKAAAKQHGEHHDEHEAKKHQAHGDKKQTDKHHDEHPQADKDGKKKEKDEKDKKDQEIQKRVEKAERELPPKIRQFMSRPRSKLRLRMQLLGWRVMYRLSKLELIDASGKQLALHAQVNPPVNLGPEGVIWSIEWREVLEVFDEIAGEVLDETTDSLDMRERRVGKGSSLRREGTYKFGTDSSGRDAEFELARKTSGWPPWSHHKVNEVRIPGASSGSRYPEIIPVLRQVPPKQLGAYLKAAYQNPEGPLPELPDAAREHVNQLFGIWQFEPGHPRLRQEGPDGKTELVPTFQHRRDHAYGMMTADLLERGDIGVEEAITGHPAQGGGAQAGARAVTASDLREAAPAPQESHKDYEAYQVRRDKELALIKAWLHSHCAGPNAPLWSSPPSKPVLAAFVKAKIHEFLHTGTK